ncbi:MULTISPECIES: phage baseplate protein [unclassified Moraxella]|uniref:phage baseplate protein n=1 Tax=unclassified Moraxella TaxID=2685852 RepID=UPI003AF5E0FC
MHRIDSATARQNLNGTGKNGFHDNADLPNQDATYLTPMWCNSVQEEIANVIEGLGVPLDKADNHQLSNILITTFAKNTALQKAINDYSNKFAEQNSRILALENRKLEDTAIGEIIVTCQHFNSPAEVAIYKGYGTWEREAEGRAIVGFSSQVDSPAWTRQNGRLFGEYEHKLNIDEMPTHSHDVTLAAVSDSGSKYFANGGYDGTEPDLLTVNSSGGDKPHNNVQPSKTYNIWRRIA